MDMGRRRRVQVCVFLVIFIYYSFYFILLLGTKPVGEESQQAYILLSPTSLILIRPRDHKDHLRWLVERERWAEAAREIGKIKREFGEGWNWRAGNTCFFWLALEFFFSFLFFGFGVPFVGMCALLSCVVLLPFLFLSVRTGLFSVSCWVPFVFATSCVSSLPC
jgi:ABC-type antimicrobial peptide transport system permease subunit